MDREVQNPHKKPLIIVLVILLFVILILVLVNLIILFRGRDNGNKSLGDDNLTKECFQDYESEQTEDCIEEKSSSYFDEGNCELALKVYDDIPEDQFDKYTLLHFYDEAYQLSSLCNDDNLEDYWEAKFNGLSSQLEAMY